MKIRLTIHGTDAGDMAERTYMYQIELPDKTPLDQVEAHAKNMLEILDVQGHTTWGEEEDDEGDDWKKGKAK